MPYQERRALYEKIEEMRGSRVIHFVTGDRHNCPAVIAQDALDPLTHHLDEFDGEKITLLLYTRGGDIIAAWSIANLLRQYCDKVEVIVTVRAHSSGTLISLGADQIVMTKQATLGPIDPSRNSPLNPHHEGMPPQQRVPVSVEAINGYMDFARHELGKNVPLTEVLLHLSEKVHPLVLGECFRARSQIKRLGELLLENHEFAKETDTKPILDFLCSAAGSHDYTINRTEARKLGLNVDKPSQELYDVLKGVHDDMAAELLLGEQYIPNALFQANQNQAAYQLRRGLIESVEGGSYVFLSEGSVMRQQVNTPAGPQVGVQDLRHFEGWRKEQ